MEKEQNKQKTEYHKDAEIKCSCGNVMTVGSTKQDMEVEICSACHPFYTGKQKVVDTAGRVERFKERFAKFEKRTENKKKKS